MTYGVVYVLRAEQVSTCENNDRLGLKNIRQIEVQSELGITRSDISKIGKVVLRSLMNASESAQPY